VPFNISNTGTAALTVSSILSSNAAVTIASPAIPFTVQPVNGSLTITSNDPAQGQIMVSFTGTALAAAGLAFGNVAVGQISSMTFNVSNTGTAALTVSSVLNSNPAFGLMTPTIPFTAPPGSQSATLTVTNNDPANPIVWVGQSESGTLTLSNTRTTPLMVTAQTTTDPAGQSTPITIVITPTQYTVYSPTLSLTTSGGMQLRHRWPIPIGGATS
jgi:hypothetical protein